MGQLLCDVQEKLPFLPLKNMFTDLVNHNNIPLKMVLLALLNGFFGTTVENAYTWGGKSQNVFQRSFIKEEDGEEESQQLINLWEI